MKVPPKFSITPLGKRIARSRLPQAAQQPEAHMGATEQDVQPLTPPPAPPSDDTQPAPLLDPHDELTPG